MRETLFRGKMDDKRSQTWIEGYLFKGVWYLSGVHNIAIIPIDTIIYPHSEIDYEPVIPETIGQWSHQADKNGKKIFDGDIVRYTDDDGKTRMDLIKFNETHSAFVRVHRCQHNLGLQYLYFDEVIAKRCEIIGNIYDNPELWEEE